MDMDKLYFIKKKGKLAVFGNKLGFKQHSYSSGITKEEKEFLSAHKKEIIEHLIEEEKESERLLVEEKAKKKEALEKGKVNIYKNISWGYIIEGPGMIKLKQLAEEKKTKEMALLKELTSGKWEPSDPDLVPKEIGDILLGDNEEIHTTIFRVLELYKPEMKTLEAIKERFEAEDAKKKVKEDFDKEVATVKVTGNHAIYKGVSYKINRVEGFDDSFGEGDPVENWIPGHTYFEPKPPKEIGKILMKAIKKGNI